jgi:2'-5' RNA ligase
MLAALIMSDSGKKRIFLGVNLSLATTRKIADVIARMQRVVDDRELRVAWVPPENLHLTLKFLGWSHAETLPAIRDRTEEWTRACKGFELVARGVGAFPDARHARILWVGVQDPSGALGRLVSDIEGAMAQLGFEREARPYHPHVTIGRVKDGRDAEELVARHAQSDFGSSLVREVVVYESIMKTKGSEYVALHRLPLDAAPYRAERQTRDVEMEDTADEEPDSHGGQHSA